MWVFYTETNYVQVHRDQKLIPAPSNEHCYYPEVRPKPTFF